MPDNRMTFTFTSEGTDGDQVVFAYARPDIGTSQVVTFTWRPGGLLSLTEILIGATVPPEPTGSTAALNYSISLGNIYNFQNQFTIERVENVVTITLNNPTYFFNLGQNDLGSYAISTVVIPDSVEPAISGQELTALYTYCYLYEPLLATIEDNSIDVTKVTIDMAVYRTEDSTLVETLIAYGEFDAVTNKPFQVDLMDMVRQYHDAKVYKIGEVDDLPLAWETVVSKYRYEFTITSDGSNFVNKVIRKIPIIGGRNFQEFEAQVLQTTPLTETEKYGVDMTSRFAGFPTITTTLADPTATDARPTITVVPSDGSGCYTKAAVIWKSYLGGWQMWGFKLENRSYKHRYEGNLDVQIFESTANIGGHIYKPVNYTGVMTDRNIQLKALSLDSNELEAVSRVNYTPAIYYLTEDGKMELMRMTAATAPLDSKANGGDFQVSLRSIGSVEQSTL